MSTNQITTSNNQFFFFSRENLENAFRLAKIFYESGCFANTVQSTQQALIILIAGAELGLKPIESMNCFYFLKGALRIYGFGLSKILSRAGVSFTFHTLNRKEVDVSYYKNGQLIQRLRYTIEDLKQLRNNNNQGFNVLDKYPEEKLVYHAHSRFLRYYDVGASIPLTDYDQEIIDSLNEEEQTNEEPNSKTEQNENSDKPNVSETNKQEKTDNATEVVAKEEPKTEDLLNKLEQTQKQAAKKLAAIFELEPDKTQV
jgi:hypothetical protein